MLSPIFTHNIQYTLLSNSSTSFLWTFTGLSPSTVACSKAVQLYRLRAYDGQHHISYMFPRRIQFALRCVQSPLLTASQLVSFPPGTKTFQFPGFAILYGSIAKSHSEIFGSTAACTSPKLIAACHVLHLFSSQAIPLLASAHQHIQS